MNELTPAAVVAGRILEMRSGLNWSQDELARRMEAYGVPWSRTTVAKVEGSTRQVTVDELVALAFVFGVAPASLLTVRSSETNINLTPNTQAPNSNAWAWYTGSLPMGGGWPDKTLSMDESADLRRRYFDAVPNHIAEGERRLPGVRRFGAKATAVARLIGVPERLVADALPGLLRTLAEIREDAETLERDVRRMGVES